MPSPSLPPDPSSGTAPARERSHSSRIPCLDGLRAISICGVLFAHSQGTQGFPVVKAFKWLGDLGNLGVRVFFVISGYLITHLLIQEFRLAGRISLKGFYIRRAFRIFPAFYVFLGCVALLTLAGLVALSWVDLAYAGTYTINFIERKSWVVGHLWSLSVEEQFYLLWPMCVVGLGWSRATKLTLALLILCPFLRITSYYFLPASQGLITKAFPTICDTIATGCALACLRGRLSASPRYLAFLKSPWFLLVPVLVLASNAYASHTRPDLIVGHSIRNLGIGLCLDWCLRNPLSLMGKILNWSPLVWMGTLSYSLYLWQQIFLNRNSDAFFCIFPLNVFLAFALAVISYYVIEKPCLRARVRFFPGSNQPSGPPGSRSRQVVPAATGGSGVANP